MANIAYNYRQVPAPRELSKQIPAPWQKEAWMQEPQGRGKFWVQIPGGVQSMAKIDSCIISQVNWSKIMHTFNTREAKCKMIVSLNFRTCRLSKIGDDAAVSALDVIKIVKNIPSRI